MKKLLLIFFAYSISLFSQSIYEPIYNTDIYNFIERLTDRGLIQLFSDIKPITRLTITEKLRVVNQQRDKLTEADRERLDFYLDEYSLERKYLEKDTTITSVFFNKPENERFNLYKYYSPFFTFTADPVLGLSYDISKKTYHQLTGVQMQGRIGDNWGFYFNYRDNLERGDKLDRHKLFSPATGVIISKNSSKSFEYSETRGGISYGWKWGMITAAKDFIQIGPGNQSSVILSDKAPSFPYLHLEISPVDWFRYDFIHGWLNSDLIDSTTIRPTGVILNNSGKEMLAYSSLPKYYVGHSISIRPFNNLWFTLGESIIYGHNVEYIYFLPVFLRLADHYISKNGSDSGGNAQIYFNSSYTWQKINSKLYFSLYIDELSLESLFSGGKNPQVYAVTLGGNFTNPLWKDNYLTFEYNAIRPYSYMNADPLHTYTSAGYQLGHWIGSNAVQLYAQMEQYLPYMINVKGYFNYVLKGSKENINDYYNGVTSTYPLLSGSVSTYSQFGIKLSYNPYNDLYFTVEYSSVLKSDGRFINEYRVNKDESFITSVRYGF